MEQDTKAGNAAEKTGKFITCMDVNGYTEEGVRHDTLDEAMEEVKSIGVAVYSDDGKQSKCVFAGNVRDWISIAEKTQGEGDEWASKYGGRKKAELPVSGYKIWSHTKGIDMTDCVSTLEAAEQYVRDEIRAGAEDISIQMFIDVKKVKEASGE